MSRKLFCLTVGAVIIGIIFASAYLASAAPPQGKGYDRILEKRTFIHYRKGFAKPEGTPGGGNNSKESECYKFIRKGLKWRNPVNLVFHPSLDGTVAGAVFDSTSAWEGATSEVLFGTYTTSDLANWDGESDDTDGLNELSFGDYPQEGVIAVTVIWGYFGGRPDQREIIEFDILFDTDFNWGDAEDNQALMDLQNIATHELGHGLGLGDIYQDACSEVTMYGYSSNGDIEKRTLEGPDITGIQELYGE